MLANLKMLLLANWVVAEWRAYWIGMPVRRFAMSIQLQPVNPVPADTARVARASFPKGNTPMKMRDEIGTLYEDEAFARLFPNRDQLPPASGYPGHPGDSPS